MEIRVLKYFLTVAREGSITRAAEILHVTQPTLSRQILELERVTGVKLLDRGSRHVSLTSDGLLLKRRAEEIVDLVDKTEKELSGSKTVEGTVNCAGGELLVMDHFSDLIMRFQEKHPLVRFDINTDITGRVNEKMDSGLIDTAIFVRPFDAEKYDYVPIGPEARFCAAMRTDDPLAQKEHVTREDLAGKKLVLISRGELNADIRSWWETSVRQSRRPSTATLARIPPSLPRGKDSISSRQKAPCRLSTTASSSTSRSTRKCASRQS